MRDMATPTLSPQSRAGALRKPFSDWRVARRRPSGDRAQSSLGLAPENEYVGQTAWFGSERLLPPDRTRPPLINLYIRISSTLNELVDLHSRAEVYLLHADSLLTINY